MKEYNILNIYLYCGIGLIIISILDFFVIKEPLKLGIFYDIIYLLVGILYISASLYYFYK